MNFKFILYTFYIMCSFVSFLIIGSETNPAYIFSGIFMLVVSVILMTSIPDSYWNYIEKLFDKIFGDEEN